YFKNTNANIDAFVTFKVFDNQQISEVVTLPLKVYTMDEALELGIVQRNTTWIYIVVVIVLVIIWFVYRRIRKARKKKNNEGRM
ncbi:MAG: hypothetical protein AABY22_35205, partial [Nanoarchaeota archaeon]